MAKIVMFWDCSYCGAKKIPGYLRECVDGCGHPRPRKVVFYHSNPPTKATPEQAALFGRPDPNWYCENCDSGNRAEDERCWKCGAPRSIDSEVHEVRTYRESEGLPYSAEEAERMNQAIAPEPQKKWQPEGGEDRYNPQSIAREEPTSYSPPARDYSSVDHFTSKLPINHKELMIIGGWALGVILAIFLIYSFFFKTHTEKVWVSEMNWTQSVHIEELQTFHEGAWSVPFDGSETDHYQKKSGDEKVHDGWTTETFSTTCYRSVTVPDTCTGYRSVSDTCYRTNGDGSSDSYSCSKSESYTYSCTTTKTESYSCTDTRQVEQYHYEDVFSTWYEYDIDRWTSVGTYPTSGEGKDLYFDPIQPQGNKQRRIEDGGTYTITFVSEEIEPFSRTYSLAEYLTFEYEQIHEVLVNAFGTILEVR